MPSIHRRINLNSGHNREVKKPLSLIFRWSKIDCPYLLSTYSLREVNFRSRCRSVVCFFVPNCDWLTTLLTLGVTGQMILLRVLFYDGNALENEGLK